jgi:hypothetical protein
MILLYGHIANTSSLLDYNTCERACHTQLATTTDAFAVATTIVGIVLLAAATMTIETLTENYETVNYVTVKYVTVVTVKTDLLFAKMC